MKLSRLLEKIEFEVLKGSLDTEITDLVYDSRKAAEGCVFLCISGTRNDAHEYIPSAVEKGAKAVVVEKKIEVEADITVIYVKSARKALSYMSAAWFDYPAEKMTTIGITGTKGKTTTSYMVKKILEDSGKKVGLIGTNGAWIAGNHYPTKNTTPESYELEAYFSEMVKAGCEFMVMEVSSQAVKMDRVAGFYFDYAMFTNISPDHIGPDEHADFEEYLDCKRQILKMCRIGFVNHDDEHYEDMIKGHTCKLYSYGEAKDADIRMEEIDYVKEHGFLGLSFAIESEKTGKMHVKVNMPGYFNAVNALAAVSVCSFVGITEEAVNQALAEVRVDGRMEIVYTSHDKTVIVDYAHNAVSMESLLKTLRSYHPKRLVVLFGCGGNRSRLRRYEMGEIAGKMADLSIITADNSRFEKVEDIIEDIKTGMNKTDGRYLVIPDRREAIGYSIKNAQEGDMICIVGKGHEDYQEIEGVRYHFSDREEAEAFL
ncbi:MAG: UDP-N-acetylmuramoyl-L-alanyl-D-glutamate--2,6-diaminopimelate ligase [Lachnospiraceae bacterium]|nr:UDP-N-acetylmuramoyl-L-alanyl-D-glutamate--2,6-diaminopimelate ligase [Lachnospiraceae bacterium]